MDLTNDTEIQSYDSHYSSIPQDIWNVQYTSYNVFLPIIILIGWIVSSFSFVVLRRTKLKATHVNTYFLLLVVADFVIFTVSIPTIKSLNGCNLRSYSYALYFVHVFFTIFYIIQTISLYLILWIAYDRFLAIWNFSRFNEIQKPSVIRTRLICTVVICILMHIEHLLNVSVTCSSDICNAGNSTCESIPLLRTKKYSCDDGIWIINDGLHYITEKPIWRQIYWGFYGLVVFAIPMALVVILNLGIAGAIMKQRFRSVSSTARTQRRDLSRIYIILAISLTFVCCTAPTLIHATFYAQNIDNCHGPYSEEVFRSIAHLLLLVEHITHFVILCFNEIFWNELKEVMSLTHHYLKKLWQWLTTKIDHIVNADKNSNISASVKVPALESSPTVPLPTINILTDNNDLKSEKVTIEADLQGPIFNHFTNKKTQGSSSSLKPPERSPTASMITLEEEI